MFAVIGERVLPVSARGREILLIPCHAGQHTQRVRHITDVAHLVQNRDAFLGKLLGTGIIPLDMGP